MKIFTYCSALVLVTLVSFPITAQAMGSRHHSSEAVQNQSAAQGGLSHTQDGNTNTHAPQSLNTVNGDPPTSVPELPSLWLLGIGIVLITMFLMQNRRFRRREAGK